MSDQTTVNPALTAEEWAKKERPGSDDALLPVRRISLKEYADEHGVWNSLHFRGRDSLVTVNRPDMHALAALALHGQPFGFTKADVAELENAADHHDWVDAAEANRIRSIAARIAALLPPAP